MTTGSSFSAPKVAVMARSGRTQLKLPLPQRIDLAQGKSPSTLGRMVESRSSASAPGLLIWAT